MPAPFASAQREEIENVKSCLPVTEFWSADGGCLLMDLADQTYIIRVDTDGSSATTYLVSQPAETLMTADGNDDYTEYIGWSAGWDC